jgi:hypothetical protein
MTALPNGHEPADFMEEAGTWGWLHSFGDDDLFENKSERQSTFAADLWHALDGMQGFAPDHNVKQYPTREAAVAAYHRAWKTLAIVDPVTVEA